MNASLESRSESDGGVRGQAEGKKMLFDILGANGEPVKLVNSAVRPLRLRARMLLPG